MIKCIETHCRKKMTDKRMEVGSRNNNNNNETVQKFQFLWHRKSVQFILKLTANTNNIETNKNDFSNSRFAQSECFIKWNHTQHASANTHTHIYS